MLGNLGIRPEHARLYIALMERPASDVESLATLAHTDEATARDGLALLVGIRLARIDDSKPAGVAPLNPAFALNRLVEQREEEIIARYRQIAETRAEIAPLAVLYSQSGPEDNEALQVERIDGVEAVRDKLDELSFFARTSILSIQLGGPQSRAALEASRSLDERAAARNLKMCVIHEPGVIQDEDNRAYLQDLMRMGVQVRISDSAGSRMVIVDRRIAVLPVDPERCREGALIVQHPGLVAGFVELFQRTWASSYDLDSAGEKLERCSDEPKMNDQDRRILSLLATGRTDESVARELGCSVRHLRRQVARLLTELGATSRFEAGVEAARRGWL
jgi:DNA-binding NarL/FixJ family response regulator